MATNKQTQKTTEVVKPELKQRGFQIFEAIGRFSVKFRWLVLAVWIIGTILAVHLFPSLSDVTQSNNSSFLPSNAPSQKAINLASTFGKAASARTVGVVVA